ncbi:MAG: kynureninase, partial [Bacteroidia bacterium]
MNYENSPEFARKLDAQDKLRAYRDQFLFPQHNGEPVVYLTGNSLGLQPKTVREFIGQELDDWAKYGVEGHFQAQNPWFSYHELLTEQSARLVGALPSEVVVMNQLTLNVHLLLISFYRPEGKRTKIICEQKAFPSDQYALETQVRLHGLNPDEHIVEVGPRAGEHTIRTEDILAAIEREGHSLAVVMIGGVNYFTGQLFDMSTITKAAHAVGALAG